MTHFSRRNGINGNAIYTFFKRYSLFLMILYCATDSFAQAPDAVTYAGTGGQQFFTIANNTNGLGFSESGWNAAVLGSSGTITADLNFAAASFSNGTVTGSNDSATPLTNDYVIAATTTGSFISGAAGSGLNIQPGAADVEADNNLQFSTFINFTNDVFAFGFDVIDIFDHGGGAYTDTWEIFLDGSLVYRIGPNLAIGAGATGTFQIFDGAGNALGNIIAGENTEIFFGFTSPTGVSQVEIRRNSVFGGGTTTGEDFHGIDSFRFSTTLDSDGDGNPNDMDPNATTPTAANDMASVDEGSSLVLDILTNDDYLDNNDTNNLGNTTIADTGGGSAGGTISFDANTGELTYTPLAGEAGSTVTVEYQVCNDVAPLNPPPAAPGAEDTCTTATVSITVNSVVTDTDGDGVPDAMDICPGFDDSVDTDGDNIPDGCDEDSDNDGILDSIECPAVAPTGGVVQGDAVFYADGLSRQFFTIANNTNGLGFSESGWDATVTGSGGTIVADLNFAAASFSNGTVTGSNDAVDPITNNYAIAVTTNGAFISGATGSGLSIEPGAADVEADDNLEFSTFINFTTPVFAFGFDVVDIFDHGGGAYTDTWEIFIDGSPVYRIGPNLAVGAGATGTFQIFDGMGASLGNITAGQDVEIFFGFISPMSISQVELRRTSVFAGGTTTGEDFHGIDSFRYSTVAPFDFDQDGIPNCADLDSDNDGIYDVVEAGNGALDTNDDGVLDTNDTGFSDSDDNGADDTAQGTMPIDTGGDGSDDFLNTDSDGDGCPDANEAYNDPDAAGSDGGQFGDGVPASVDATTGLVTEPGVDYTTGTNSAVTDNSISEACCTVEAPALSPN